MAIGWLTLFKAIPWIEVVRQAPEIAENAKKLWGTAARNPPKTELEVRSEYVSGDEEISWLKERLTAIEADNSNLHNQMLKSSELIEAFAEQNTQLIKRIELNHKRILKLAVFTIVIGCLVVYCITLIT